jgi:hypothetical protein
MAQYRFRSTWRIDAPVDVVRAVVMDAARYPLWWPQVRSVESTPEGLRTVCRSFLPYELRFIAVYFVLEDGTIAADLQGDLDGVVHVQLRERDGVTHVLYRQDVTLEKVGLRMLSPVLRPFFRWNHAVMMRSGRRGLARYLGRVARGPQDLV